MCKASRHGSPISHFFFADDLLLFGESSIKQVEAMERVLSHLCRESGQKVNLHKSNLLFSPNYPRSSRMNIVGKVGIQITGELGHATNSRTITWLPFPTHTG